MPLATLLEEELAGNELDGALLDALDGADELAGADELLLPTIP